MTILHAEVKGERYVTSEADPDDSWDRDNTAFTYEGLTITVGDESDGVSYRGMYSEFFDVPDVKPGDEVYAVVVRYNTGDTFGNDDGVVVVMNIFTHPSPAQDLYDALGDCKNHSLTVNGVKYYIPFNGYFESLEDVLIENEVVRS